MNWQTRNQRHRGLLKASTFLLLFAGAFWTSVTLSRWLVPRYLKATTHVYTEAGRTRHSPRQTFNKIQEWAPKNVKTGNRAEWGIEIRPGTDAQVQSIWRGRQGHGLDWMDVAVRFGGNVRATLNLNPAELNGPIALMFFSDDKSREYRDIDGNGSFDMVLERVLQNGTARLAKAAVVYSMAYASIDLEKPFNDQKCTVITPNDGLKELVFSEPDGVWNSSTETIERIPNS